MPAPYASADKRAELVLLRRSLLHQQGFHRTTLAHVASRAEVPLGNVYYYFKTKDALAEAVIACARGARSRAQFAVDESTHARSPARLRCLVRAPLDACRSAWCSLAVLTAASAKSSRSSAPKRVSGKARSTDFSRSTSLGPRGSSTPMASPTRGARSGRRFRRGGPGSHAPRACHALGGVADRQLRRVERWLDDSLSSHNQVPNTTHDATSATSSQGQHRCLHRSMAKHAPGGDRHSQCGDPKLADSGIADGALTVGARAPGSPCQMREVTC